MKVITVADILDIADELCIVKVSLLYHSNGIHNEFDWPTFPLVVLCLLNLLNAGNRLFNFFHSRWWSWFLGPSILSPVFSHWLDLSGSIYLLTMMLMVRQARQLLVVYHLVWNTGTSILLRLYWCKQSTPSLWSLGPFWIALVWNSWWESLARLPLSRCWIFFLCYHLDQIYLLCQADLVRHQEGVLRHNMPIQVQCHGMPADQSTLRCNKPG